MVVHRSLVDRSECMSDKDAFHAGKVDLFYVCMQLCAFVTVSLPACVPPGGNRLVYFIHILLCGAMIVAVTVQVMKSWRRITTRKKALALFGIAMMNAYIPSIGLMNRPEAFFFIFVLGIEVGIRALDKDVSTSRSFRVLLSASMVLSLAILSDQVFLWTGTASRILQSAIEKARGATGLPLISLSFSYMGGWQWLLVLVVMLAYFFTLRPP